MGKHFSNVNTLEQQRKQYKELLKKYHPDNGRNVTDMQEGYRLQVGITEKAMVLAWKAEKP